MSDNIAELQKLYITKNSRGKGYSSRLIMRIFQEARLAGYEQLYLETSTELATAVASINTMVYSIATTTFYAAGTQL